jgi:hypothetical protein
MTGLPDPARRLDGCPLVIFIAYTVAPEAQSNGYSDWLRRVDMPFFNAIPGVQHYANWRLGEVLTDPPPAWDWFDFQGLETEDDLERVWFDPGLDEFRANWIRLWGYGSASPPPVLRHAYVMRPVGDQRAAAGASTATLSGSMGAPPPDAGSVDLMFRVEKTLHKHFGGRNETRPWLTPASEFNPLELDWIGVGWGMKPPPAAATFAATATLVAAPDRS